MSENKIDIDLLLAKATKISINKFEVQDTDKVILDIFKQIYEEHGDLWTLQTQLVSKLDKFTNVKHRMERLAIKGLLESRLFGNRKVYRLKVANVE